MVLRVQRHLDSPVVRLPPEAASLIGKDVRITIEELPAFGTTEIRRDLSALDAVAGHIDMDWDAWEDLRRRSVL